MMSDDGWPNLTRGRTLVLLLALLGLGWLLLQTRASDEVRLSLWRAPHTASDSTAAQNTLSGVAVAQAGRGLNAASLRPWGNPLGAPNTVITQGYGVGTHAPAEVWGAIDLAIDGNGDGAADPEGSWGHPIYASHSGTVKVTPNSYPAGNHVWVVNDQYRTGYSHLRDFAVTDGQVVEQGQLIGYLGSTGMSSGPHLDYQVWQMRNGQWVNLNPLDFGPLEITR